MTTSSLHTLQPKLEQDKPNLAKVSLIRVSCYTITNSGDLAGDTFVRELDVSKITLRLKQKHDKKGDADQDEHTIAKLQGSTLDILQRCLVSLLVPFPQFAADGGSCSTRIQN